MYETILQNPIELFNLTEDYYPDTKTLHELFEETAASNPDKTALIFLNQKMTYKVLNEKANQFAWHLKEKGIVRDEIVGVFVKRSFDLVIGILGILKAGGAYLPIETEYPQERITFMLNDSKCRFLLSTSDLCDKGKFDQEIIFMDHLQNIPEKINNPPVINKSSDLLFIIYTSGTTGTPKGVMLTHRILTNLIFFEYRKTNIDFSTRVLQFATISFDVCCQEIFSTLIAAGELYLITNEIKKDVFKLTKFISDNCINILFFPTAFLKYFSNKKEYLDCLPVSVRHIITAGEQLIVTDTFKHYLKNIGVFLHNHYGPSETHACTTLTIDPEMTIPDVPTIGRPISNTAIHILNENLKVVPINVIGEIYISGDCVSRGYLGNELKTSEKYFIDPFNNNRRMYKTGDLGRWLENGTIEFIGRIDHQIKIMGYRIEIPEVEAIILKHPSIRETVVIANDDYDNNKFLCAYFVASKKLTVSEIRTFLTDLIPQYMLPSYFIQLDHMPLTTNGKVDRKALPDFLEHISTGIAYEAPITKTEQDVSNIWMDLLNLKKIGRNDVFFDLGGNSMKMLIYISKVNKLFGIKLAFGDVFNAKTVKDNAVLIESNINAQCKG